MSLDVTEFFTRVGKFAHAANQLVTSLITSWPTALTAAINQFGVTDSIELNSAVDNAFEILESMQGAGSGTLVQAGSEPISKMLLTLMAEDNASAPQTQLAAAEYLRDQMIAQSKTLDEGSSGQSVTPGGSNTGDGLILAAARTPRGTRSVLAVAETLSGEFDAGTLTLQGRRADRGPLSIEWPLGTGATVAVTSQNAVDGNMIQNGSFSAANVSDTDFPDDWSLQTGDITTDCLLTTPASDSIAITGSPTEGIWHLKSGDLITPPIAYNPTAATIASALQALPGFENISVTGSGPFAITMTGVGPSATLPLTIVDKTDGTVSGTPVAGDSRRARGARGLEIIGAIEIGQQVAGLAPSTAYAISVWVGRTSGSGDLDIELADGTGGSASVLVDAEGNNCRLRVDITTAGATATGYGAIIHTPAVLPDPVYLRIIAPAGDYVIDEVLLQPATAMYADGPQVAVVEGPTPWVNGDSADVAITNDRAGQLLEWTHRFLGLDQLGIDLPVAATGTEQDTLIA